MIRVNKRWRKNVNVIISYDEKNRLSSISYSVWDARRKIWAQSRREEYIYNDDGTVDHYTSLRWAGVIEEAERLTVTACMIKYTYY
jgi:hypothetical protein